MTALLGWIDAAWWHAPVALLAVALFRPFRCTFKRGDDE